MILIVDDKPENLIALSKALESRGFHTDTAQSGEETLKKVLKQTYELIILDVQMPGMDGFEVAEAISGYSKTADIPIIFLSAVNISKEFITKGYASGGRDYLVKPFDTDILVLKIQTFIKLSEIQRSLQIEIEQRKLAESKKDEFISIASHELNTPLTSAKGYLQLAELSLKNQELDQTQLYLERSSKQLNKLNSLVTDLLDATKIESGKLKLSFKEFELFPFLENAISNMHQSYPDKKIKIITQATDIEGITVFADENRLEQVLLNYLGNAIKYAPDSNEVTLEVKVLNPTNDKVGNTLKISVIDQGIGISEDKQQLLFQKYYRVEETACQFQGLGMGLYICAEIIKLHHGTHGVKSEIGKGSTFYFQIPLRQAATIPSH